MAIENIPIRASIVFETGLVISTPYILSFNVNKTRGQAATFQASVKVNRSLVEAMNGKLYIEAGEKGNLKRIFTGYVQNTVPSPCWDDPAFFVVNITGSDELFKLTNRKFTRRQVITDTSWAVINDVVSQGAVYGKLKYTNNSPVVLMSDEQSLKALEAIEYGKEKKDQEPQYDTNKTKDKQPVNQKIEATIGYVDVETTETE